MSLYIKSQLYMYIHTIQNSTYVATSPKSLHTLAYTIAEAVGMHTAGEAA